MTENITATVNGSGPAIAVGARREVPEFVRPSDRPMNIRGRPVFAASGRTLANIDPTTEEPLASIVRGGAEEVDAAVRAAQAAFENPSWSGIAPDVRSTILLQIADIFEEHGEELANIESRSMGVPITMTRHMMAAVAATYRHFADWPTRLNGHTVPTRAAESATPARNPSASSGASGAGTARCRSWR